MLLARPALLAMGFALALPTLAAADTYTLANFSGAINGGNANVKAPFSGNGFTQGMAFSGSFVFDNNLIPGPASGLQNVFDQSFPDIANIPAAAQFTLNFGPLTFTEADNDNNQIPFGIQFSNGHFNGFEFIHDFTFNANPYELRIDGSVLHVVAIVNGFPTFSNLINAHINIGDANVTGQAPFSPTVPPPPPPPPGVPEPASWALMILGFGAVGGLMRRRQAKALA
jgi:hypothetical protein